MDLFKEFWLFLMERKVWWMAPILLTVIVLAALVAMTSSGSAVLPFIYALF